MEGVGEVKYEPRLEEQATVTKSFLNDLKFLQ